MSTNWELFQNAYLTADDDTKQLIDSDKIPRAIDLAVQTGDITEEQVRAVLLDYPLYVLQVYTKDELGATLKAVGVAKPEQVISQLDSILGHTSSATVHTNKTDTAKPAGLHTMADDMAAAKSGEPTYTSTQAAILREGRTTTPEKTDNASTSAWQSSQ